MKTRRSRPDPELLAVHRAANSDILDAKLLAILLGLTEQGALGLIKGGHLGPFGKLGRRYVVLRKAMLGHLAQRFAREQQDRERLAVEQREEAERVARAAREEEARAADEERERVEQMALTKQERADRVRRRRVDQVIGKPSEEALRLWRRGARKGGAK